jgi:hypothetical protein
MTTPRTELLSITTDGDGDGSASSSGVFWGPLRTIIYTPDATSPLATGFDVTVVSAVTGQTLWTGTNVGTSAVTVNPRQPVHDSTGAPSLFAGGGEAVEDYFYLAQEGVTVTVAEGGDTKTGTFRVIGG